MFLAAGAFAIGTATFITAPLIPAIAAELGVSLPTAGHLVTLYALTYAVGSPIFSTLLGGLDRKTLLVGALAAFTVVNLLATAVVSFWQLMAIQVLTAIAAGLFMPAANGVAATIVPPAQRGRAIAVVIGGLSIALALGVPIGSMIGGLAHWRVAFVFIAIAGAIGVVGLVAGLPRDLPRGSATLSDRLAIGRRPDVLLALAVTFLWAMGVFSLYTFIAPFLTRAIGFQAASVPIILFVFGVAGWLGNVAGGRLTDRLGAARTLGGALVVLGTMYLVFGLAALNGPSAIAMASVACGFVIAGIAGWAFHPAQSARLVQYAPDAAVVALSLNQSALYFGTAAGAALGALIVASGSPINLAWNAAAWEFAGLAVLLLSVRRMRAALQAAE